MIQDSSPACILSSGVGGWPGPATPRTPASASLQELASVTFSITCAGSVVSHQRRMEADKIVPKFTSRAPNLRAFPVVCLAVKEMCWLNSLRQRASATESLSALF